MVSKKIQILITLLTYTQSIYALVGGTITENDKVVRLSKCENIRSRTQGTSHGCKDLNVATGSFISRSQILTSGHFVAHFVFNAKKDNLKIKIGNKEVKLVFKRDFFIHMSNSYYKYEEQVRGEVIKALSSIETCMYDIAIIELTEFGRKKISNDHFYKINKKAKQLLGEEIKMYGYGVHKLEVYNQKKRTLGSVLSWALSFGQSSSKTWIKNKKIDEKLRTGKNELKRASGALLGLKFDFKVNTSLLAVKTNMLKANYYSAYLASGDSGAPVIMNNKVIGVACGLTSMHTYDSIDLISIITPVQSRELENFWNKKRKTIK